MRLLDSSLMPPPRGGFRGAPGAVEVQRWCSPQSSVPRQTVGHHARAATYEMGLNNLRRLPCGGAQCEPDDPPTGPFHIPTDRCAGRRTHERADARAAGFRKTQFVCVSLKIDSRPHKTTFDSGAVGRLPAAAAGRGEGAGGRPLRRRDPAPQAYPAPTLHPPCTHLAPTHPAPTLHLPRAWAPSTPSPTGTRGARGSRHRAPTLRPPCTHLPCTYPAPTLHPVASLGPARHAHPHPRPTLHLPCTRPPRQGNKANLLFYRLGYWSTSQSPVDTRILITE